MAKFSDLRKGLSNLELLEHKLHLKQLQVNSLLNITQAINDNVSAEGLYKMYNSFLSWEMEIKKMALYVKEEKNWICASSIGIEEELKQMDISDILQKYNRLKNLEDEKEHSLVKEFDIIIPVLHKETPIAYTFIGGFDENDDMYNKVQFITTITNVIAVAIENKRLFKQQLEQERLRREMELASEMQKMLIPNSLPSEDCFELSSIYKPHLGVGGDFFDFVEFDDNKFAFCIADIAGKGLAAALLMANFQANFRALINKRTSLTEFVKELNQSVLRITNGDRFLTFFVAEFDKSTYELRYISAGHNPPILVMNGETQLLKKGSTILGSFKELPEVEEGHIQINGEALILTFTDGLTDIQNEKEAYFDEDLLSVFVKEHYQSSATAFNEKLMEHIERFKGDRSYPDDFTLLTCKIFDQSPCRD